MRLIDADKLTPDRDLYEGQGYSAVSCEQIDKAETIERTKGKWILPKQDDGMSEPIAYQVRCSICGFDIDPQTFWEELKRFGGDKYCSCCGSKMVREKGEK